MITPEYLNEVVEKTEIAVNRLNNALMKDVIKHIVRAFTNGQELLIPSTIHDLHKIVQSGYSIDDLQKILEKALPSLQEEIRSAFLQSANEIAKYNDEFTRLMIKDYDIDIEMSEYTFEHIPKSAKELHMTKVEILKLENAYKRTNFTVKNMTQTTVKSIYQDYINACDDAYMKAQAGQTPSKAVASAVESLVKKGCTTVQYPSGHTDKIDVAIARAVRTGINQANSEIILTRCSEMGVGYVKVSQHLGARVTKNDDYTNHSWWQGKVYSLDWNKEILSKNMSSVSIEDDKEFAFLAKIKRILHKEKKYNYPDFVETCGYGTIEGIIGINCRHTFMMWNPKYQVDHEEPIDKAENEKRFNQEQTQRAMERRIRRLKGERDAFKQLPSDDYVNRKIAEYTNKINLAVQKYKDYCDTNKLPYYSDRLGVGVI